MATEDSYIQSGHGVGSRSSARQLSVLTVNGANTVKGPITVPAGSWLNAIAIETPSAITGTPTNCNVTVGTTDGGSDIVAAVDCKGQGHVAATIATAFDKVGGLATLNTLFIQVASTGTAPAGTINVLVSYDAPAR